MPSNSSCQPNKDHLDSNASDLSADALMQSCAITADQLIDQDFLKARAQLLEVAAFLDRVDRHQNKTKQANTKQTNEDDRIKAIKQACQLLSIHPSSQCEQAKVGVQSGVESRFDSKVESVLRLFSDHTDDLLDVAPSQPARGVAIDSHGDVQPNKQAL